MFGERLKTLRQERNLTQKQVFTAIGLSERNYQSLEYGNIKPSFDTLIAISQFFNISSDWLLELTDNRSTLPQLPNNNAERSKLNE